MRVSQLAWALYSIRSFHCTPWCMASIFLWPELWLPWVIPDVLNADTFFSKERRKSRPSETHLFVKRAFPSVQDRHHFCHIFVESLLHRGEGEGQPVMSLPSPAVLSQSGTVAPSIFAAGSSVQTPHHFCLGLCLPLGTALLILQQAGWEPLHCCPEGLRLKRGSVLTVPLRPWQELSIPTAHSIKWNHLTNAFSHVVWQSFLFLFQWSPMGSWNSYMLSLNAAFIAMFDKWSLFKLIWNAWRGWFKTAVPSLCLPWNHCQMLVWAFLNCVCQISIAHPVDQADRGMFFRLAFY